jgi:flagellar biosynthesis/type III secretory pathway M-ring protein FliF/YscJ
LYFKASVSRSDEQLLVSLRVYSDSGCSAMITSVSGSSVQCSQHGEGVEQLFLTCNIQPKRSYWLIILGVLIAMILLAVIVFGVIMWRRRRHSAVVAAVPEQTGFETSTDVEADIIDDDAF